MKTNLSSLEIHCLVDELQALAGGRTDSIYHPKESEVLLQFYLKGKGKQILRIIAGKFMFLTNTKEEYGEPSEFCMALRRHLGNSRLRSIRQLESERIVEMVFEREEEKKLFIEMFGGGNIILCSGEGIIVTALFLRKFKDRQILPKATYSYPKMPLNLFRMPLAGFKEAIKSSERDIVRCLAADIGLGGVYSEEVCLQSGTGKNRMPRDLRDSEMETLFKKINELIGKKTESRIVYRNSLAEDVVPFGLELYAGMNSRQFGSFNEALGHYFLCEHKEERQKSAKEKEIDRLKRMIENQEMKIKELEREAGEEAVIGDAIYSNYQKIKKLLDELKRASEKFNLQEIREKLKGSKRVKTVNPKEKTVEISLE